MPNEADRNEIRRTTISTVTKAVVGGALAGIAAAAVAIWAWLQTWEPAPWIGAVPAEHVIVASTVSCKELAGGWSNFDDAGGRFIIGAGSHSENGLKAYTPYGVRPQATLEPTLGGEEEVTLTPKQMPKHNHFLSSQPNTNPHDGLGGSSANYGLDENYRNAEPSGRWGRMERMISETGDSQHHNNMPPYIALYFCKKD